MKKLLAVCLAAGILTITGCSADTVAGITEQSQFQRGEADSASQAEQTGTAGLLRLLHLRRYVPLNRPEKRTSFPSLMSRL